MVRGKWIIAGLLIISVVLSGETNEEQSDTCVWVGVEVNLECKHNGSESCDTPDKPVYGGYHNNTHGHIYMTGDTITYYCHRGYQLVGQSNRVCTGTHNGWQPDEPHCQPEYIGHLMRRLDCIENKLTVTQRKTPADNNTLEIDGKISAMDNNISAMGKNLSIIDNTVTAVNMRVSDLDKNVSVIANTISATNSRMTAFDEIVSAMNNTITAMNNKIVALENKLSANDNKVSSIDNKVSAVDNKVSAVDNKVSAVDNKVSAVDNKVSAVDNKVSAIDNKVSAIDNKVSAVDNKISAVDNKIKGMENTISNTESLDFSLPSLEPFNCSMTQMKERLMACANDSNPSSPDVLSKCLTMQSGVRNGLNVSEYTWVIEDFNSKVKETDWTPYYSPPFYQTVPGYKYVLKGEIDNDSEIRIYLYLLPGEYDHLLTWPVNKKSELTIFANNGTEILRRHTAMGSSNCVLHRPTYAIQFRCQNSGPSWGDVWKNKQHISQDDTALIKLYIY